MEQSSHGDAYQDIPVSVPDAAATLNEGFEGEETQQATEGAGEDDGPKEEVANTIPARPAYRKHSASVTPPSTQPGTKRSHHKRPRQKDADVITEEFASGFRILAQSLTASGGGPSSPERRTAAIKALQDDTWDEMSEDEQVKAVRIIQRNTAVADSYLALEKKTMRLKLIRAELNDLY